MAYQMENRRCDLKFFGPVSIMNFLLPYSSVRIGSFSSHKNILISLVHSVGISIHLFVSCSTNHIPEQPTVQGDPGAIKISNVTDPQPMEMA